MEICDKCGKAIELNNAFERVEHLFDNEFYCDNCYEDVKVEVYLRYGEKKINRRGIR